MLDEQDFKWTTGEGEEAYVLTVGDISIGGSEPLSVQQKVQQSLEEGSTPEAVVLQTIAREHPWAHHIELRNNQTPIRIDDQLILVQILSGIGFSESFRRWIIQDQYGYIKRGRGRNFLKSQQQMENLRLNALVNSAESIPLDKLIVNPEQVHVQTIVQITDLSEVPPIRILVLPKQYLE